MSGLRDFLLLFFFIDLGSGLKLSAAGLQLGPALVLSVFVLVGNPLIVVAIMGAMGYRQLQPYNLTILGIDFDPQDLRVAAAEGLPVQYGDSEDPEFTSSLPLTSATVVVSTLPSLEANAAISHGLQSAGFPGHFIATAHNDAEVVRLEFLGAQRTLLPFLDAAERAAELIVGDLSQLRAKSANDSPT